MTDAFVIGKTCEYYLSFVYKYMQEIRSVNKLVPKKTIDSIKARI